MSEAGMTVRQSERRIYRVGVTGGIGSGKSLACSFFHRLGVPVISADDEAKRISVEDPEVRQGITRIFGLQAFQPDGSLNRTYLATVVFEKKSNQQKLNALVHPRVERFFDFECLHYEREGRPWLVLEAALIFEAGLDRKLDAVVVVDASEHRRVERVKLRDRVDEPSVRSRIRAQLDPREKMKRADYVLNNEGSIQELERNVRFLYDVFQSISNEGPRA